MTANKPSRSDLTAADDKVIGFEYQYYYFLYCLLNLDEGEEVGLEVKDDVHIEQANGITILAQLKHTINPKTNKLTELDSDLWKTLSNWALLIKECGEGMAPLEAVQKEVDFCTHSKFILITNKGESQRNLFLQLISDYKNGSTKSDKIDEYLTNLSTKTQDNNLKKYINDVIFLSDSTLKEFLFSLDIVTGFDDIIEKIKARLIKYWISKSKVETILKILDGAIRQASFDAVKNRRKLVITYDEFHKKYEIYFQIGKSDELVIEDYGCELENPLEQIFIKQLIDIKDLFENEDEDIIKYTEYKFIAFNNLMRWLQDGHITEAHWEKFDDDSTTRWENAFKKAHRSIRGQSISISDEEEVPYNILQLAQACLDEIRGFELSIRNQSLGIQLSNGQFYHLSDSLKIGWLINWKTKYGTDKR